MRRPADRSSAPTARSSPARRILSPGFGRPDSVSLRLRHFLHDHSIATRRNSRPGKDTQGRARRHRRNGCIARRYAPRHRQVPRRLADKVGKPDRIAVHGGIVEQRQWTSSSRRLGKHSAMGMVERQALHLGNLLNRITNMVGRYFAGQLKAFTTPLAPTGTPFQKRVWEELQKIPHGETRSYAAIAAAIGRPTAFRAVAQANGANRIAIVIPCHRVINTSGALGGYSSGVERKQWLLQQEAQR